VTVAASLFGETTQLVPGLEPKGSAGADEDLARVALFYGLAIGLTVNRGCRVQGAGCRVQGAGSRVEGGGWRLED